MTGQAALKRRSKVLLVLAAVLVPCLAWSAYVAWGAYRAERAAFVDQRHPPRLAPEAFEVDGLRAVAFPSRARSIILKGYYAPPKNGAAVVLCHGSMGERSDLVDEARILGRAGFGVLAFDFPGHGESEGEIHWGEPERLALQGALDFLTAQAGVDAQRLGVFGFSMGGYIVTQVAAADPRVAAAAMASSPHDPEEHTRWEYRHLGFLRQGPALYAIRAAGMQLDEQVPVREIGKIAPRPVLIVSGADDEAVPRWVTQRLFDAAKEPKRELVVKGAGHGGYAAADPAGYARGLLDFFGVLIGAAATSGAETRAP